MMMTKRAIVLGTVAAAVLGGGMVATSPAANAAPCDPVVRRGDSGSCIKRVQKVLNFQVLHSGWGAKSLPPGKKIAVDGKVGPETVEAIKRFQHGVNQFYMEKRLDVDGVMGKESWKHLCMIHGKWGYDLAPDNSVGFKWMRAAGCTNPRFAP